MKWECFGDLRQKSSKVPSHSKLTRKNVVNLWGVCYRGALDIVAIDSTYSHSGCSAPWGQTLISRRGKCYRG